MVVKKLPASAAVTKKRKLSASSDDSSASGGGNRRKSARENGQDKASDGGDGRVVVKEANVPEVEIIETLKVKIKPRSTPKKTTEGAKGKHEMPFHRKWINNQ